MIPIARMALAVVIALAAGVAAEPLPAPTAQAKERSCLPIGSQSLCSSDSDCCSKNCEVTPATVEPARVSVCCTPTRGACNPVNQGLECCGEQVTCGARNTCCLANGEPCILADDCCGGFCSGGNCYDTPNP